MDAVTHFEIPYDDLEKAKEFYGKVFGWKIDEMPELNYSMVYTTEVDEKFMAKSPNKINGGMYKRGEEGAKSPLVVIDVQDLDKAIEKIKEAGGEIIMEKREIPNMGYYAQFKDTEGNISGIWEAIKQEEK